LSHAGLLLLPRPLLCLGAIGVQSRQPDQSRAAFIEMRHRARQVSSRAQHRSAGLDGRSEGKLRIG
jgi:hypothetical protein